MLRRRMAARERLPGTGLQPRRRPAVVLANTRCRMSHSTTSNLHESHQQEAGDQARRRGGRRAPRGRVIEFVFSNFNLK